MGEKPIVKVVEEYAPRWLALPGIVGVGVGESGGQPCIKVFVSRRAPETLASIGHSVEGWPVVVEQSGDIRALGNDAADS